MVRTKAKVRSAGGMSAAHRRHLQAAQAARHRQFLHRRDMQFEPLRNSNSRPRGGTNARRTRDLQHFRYANQRVQRHAVNQISTMVRRRNERRASFTQARRRGLPYAIGDKIGSYFK